MLFTSYLDQNEVHICAFVEGAAHPEAHISSWMRVVMEKGQSYTNSTSTEPDRVVFSLFRHPHITKEPSRWRERSRRWVLCGVVLIARLTRWFSDPSNHFQCVDKVSIRGVIDRENVSIDISCHKVRFSSSELRFDRSCICQTMKLFNAHNPYSCSAVTGKLIRMSDGCSVC